MVILEADFDLKNIISYRKSKIDATFYNFSANSSFKAGVQRGCFLM